MPVMIRARRGTLVVVVGLAGLGLACGDDGPVETGSTGGSGSLDGAPTTVETSTTATVSPPFRSAATYGLIPSSAFSSPLPLP